MPVGWPRLPFALQRGLLVLFIWSQRVILAPWTPQWRYKLLVAGWLMTNPRWLLSHVPPPIRRLMPKKWREEILRRVRPSRPI